MKKSVGKIGYLGVVPPVGDGGLASLCHHQGLHVLQTGLWWDQTLEWYLVGLCCH